ncbi:hypothetical protein [Desulfoplanes sp.]
MTTVYKVETQGISQNFAKSTGEYESIKRGSMDQEALLDLLNRVRHMDDPSAADPDGDLCPPHVLVDGPSGQFSFVVAGSGDFYNVEHDVHVSPIEAVSVAGGLNPSGGTTPQPQNVHHKSVPHPQADSRPAPRPAKKPGLFGKLFSLFMLFVLIFVALVVYAMVMGDIDDTALLVITGVVTLLWLVFKKRFRSSRATGPTGHNSHNSTMYNDPMYGSGRWNGHRDYEGDSSGSDTGGGDDGGSDD